MTRSTAASSCPGAIPGPRERLLDLGEAPLSDAELIALVLGTGTSKSSVHLLAWSILRHFGGLRQMSRASPAELQAVDGVGPAKAARLKAAVELARRMARASGPDKPRITGALQVFELVHLELRDLRYEVFEVMLLDAKHRLLRRHRVSVGTLTGSLVHPREVFRPAILEGAAAVILVHNHPSGDPTPSQEDVSITGRLTDAGVLLGIHVLDHVVVGDGRYISLADTARG